MTILDPTKLEKFDYAQPYWVHVYNKNIDRLNDVLLKLRGLGNVRSRYMQDGCILVWVAEKGQWQGRKFRKKLGDGISCFRDDSFDGSDNDPPNSVKWRIISGTPTIQGNRLRLQNGDEIQSKWSMTGDFDIFVFFDLTAPGTGTTTTTTSSTTTTSTTTTWADVRKVSLEFEIDSTHFLSVGAGYDLDGNKFDSEWDTGSGQSSTSVSRTNERGLLRINRQGSWVSAWYKDGFRDPQWRLLGAPRYVGSGSGKIKLLIDSDTNFTAYCENFRVARGCNVIEITTTTTTTTTTTV